MKFKRAHQGSIWILDSDTPPNCTLSRHLETVGPEPLILFQVHVALQILKEENPWAALGTRLERGWKSEELQWEFTSQQYVLSGCRGIPGSVSVEGSGSH